MNESIPGDYKKKFEKIKSIKNVYPDSEYKREIKKFKIENRLDSKDIVILYYANGLNKCYICGENNINKLLVHHSFLDGKQFRDKTKLAGMTFFQWLIKNRLPDNLGLKIACYSCNAKMKTKIDD